MPKGLTGYPSIDRPWLKYYDEDAIKGKLPEGSIYDYIYEKNKGYVNGVALTYFKRQIRYSTLFSSIEKCSKSLAAFGVRRGDIVTIQALNMPQTVILLYALSRIGAVSNMIYVTVEEEEVHQVLLSTKSKIYITIDSLLEKIQGALKDTLVEHVVYFSLGEEADPLTRMAVRLKTHPHLSGILNVMSWQMFLSYSAPEAIVHESALPVAMVYTGGTTGKSKAVVLTNHNLNSLVSQYEKAKMGFERGETFLNILPPFIAFGLSIGVHLPLCMGMKTYLMLDGSAAKVGEFFAKCKPNYFIGGALHVESIITHPLLQNDDLSYMKLMGAGGDAVSIELENRANTFLKTHHSPNRFAIGYGMTELSATVCTASPVANKVGSVGIPFPDVVVKIVDPDTLQELTYGEAGEICVQSPTTMDGYYHQPEETKDIIRPHIDGSLWLHTGDIGKMDDDGFLFILGRIKRVIVVVQEQEAVYHKVYPKLVEDILEQHPIIHEIAVVGRPVAGQRNELVAFVATENRDIQIGERLSAWAAERLKKWERPVEYRIIDALPRTLIGKVDYRTLEEMARAVIKT